MLVRSIHVFWIVFSYSDGAQQDCQNNKLVVYTDNTCITLYSIPPFTNTFGSNVTYRCSSRLQQLPASGLDFCPVEVCQLDGTWTNGYVSCGLNECYNPGSSICYNGRRTCGISGTLCQSWSSQTPHPHAYTSPHFPEGNITLANNYCRDPNGVKGQPWCFTTNPNIIWEYCEISTCADLPVTGGTCEATLPTPPSTTCPLALTSALTTTSMTTTTSINTTTTMSTTSMPTTTTTPSTTSMPETTTTPPTTSMPTTTTTPSATSMPETTTTPPTTSMPATTTTPPTTSMPATTTTPSTTSMPIITTTSSTTSMPETTTTPSTTSMPTTTTAPSTTSMPTETTTPSTSSSLTSAQTTAPLGSVGELYRKFYRKIFADLPNYIQIQFLPNIRTMLSCAGNCNKREDCNVYVINPTTKECILYTFNTTGSNIPCSGSYTCYLRYS